MLTLREYTKETQKIVRWYIKRKYGGLTYKGIDLIDDELIGKCTTRLINAELKYKSSKSQLSMEKYKRMQTIYELRSHLQLKFKTRRKTYRLQDHYEYPQYYSPGEIFERKEEKEKILVALRRSKLDKKHKKYIRNFLNGYSLIDIAHENKTTSPVVKRIILEGVSQLKGINK